MTDTRTIAMIAVTENEIAMGAETAIGIESAETGAGTRCAEKTGTKSWSEHPRVTMVVLMEVSRVGAEAEVEKMTVDTHAATETAPMKPDAEMAIFIEGAAVLAHALGARIDITVPEATAAIETM
jgi:hypothetical protein